MASNSTTLATTGGYARGFTLSISWGENSTNTANNTSNITATATISKDQAIFSVTNAGVLRCYWHDNHENYDRLIGELSVEEIGYTTNSRSTGGSFNATHNDDGTLSGYAWAQWELTRDYGGYPPRSGSVGTDWVGLTNIPRQVNISSVSGGLTDENFTPTVKWTNNGNRVDIRIETPDLGGSIKTWTNKQGSSSFSPTLTSAEMNTLLGRMANTNTTTLRFVVATVIDGSEKFWDWIDKTFTIVNANPTFSDFTYQDGNSTTTAITGNNQYIIAGKSQLHAKISTSQKAVAKKSATMSNYTFAINGTSTSQAYSTSAIDKNLGTISIADNITANTNLDLTVTAIDSRSNKTSKTKSVTVVPYRAPVINATATRLNGFENDTTVKISGAFSPILVGSTAKNTVATTGGFQYRYKLTNSTTWIVDWTNLTATVTPASGTATVPDFVLDLDNQQSYTIEIKMTDKLETTTASLTVSVGQPAFYIGTDGRVGVGGMPTQNKKSGEQGLLQVMGRIFSIDGELKPSGIDVVGSGNNVCYKFPDGLMIAAIRKTQTVSFAEWGAIYETENIVPPDYAQAFISTPSCSVGVEAAGLQCWAMLGSGRTGTQNYAGSATRAQAVCLGRTDSVSNVSVTIAWTAIGRWK